MCRGPTCSANNKATTSLFKSLQLLAIVAQSLNRVRLFTTQWTVAHQAPLCMGFLGKNIGVSCHFLHQGIFLTQGLNPCLLHWQTDSLPLHYLQSPVVIGIAWLRCCGQAQSRGVENRQYKGYKKQGCLNMWHLSPYRETHNLSFFSFSVLKIIYNFTLSPNSRSNSLTFPISF